MKCGKNAFPAFLIFIFCLLATSVFASDISFDASVDKTTVSFGENLVFTLTMTQALGNGHSTIQSLPRIDSIPNFDIAGTRSGQRTSFVNGVGQSQIQHVYDLVPQKDGTFEIPALTINEPDGTKHTTKPITVTVLPAPAEEDEKEEDSPTASSSEEDRQKAGSPFFKLLLAVGTALGLIVILVVVFAALSNHKHASKPRFTDEEFEKAANKATAPEDAQIVTEKAPEKPVLKHVDFLEETSKLKREHSEVNKEFYQKYFALFQQAMSSNNSCYAESMTADEMLKKASDECGSSIKSACERLSRDIDNIVYANRQPARAFSAIDTDAKDILNAIIQ